jgi:Ion channel
VTRGKTNIGRLIGVAYQDPEGPRFGLLLLLLISAYVISAFTSDVVTSALQVLLFLAAITLAVRTARLSRRTSRLILVIAVIGSVSAVALALSGLNYALGVANLWTALMLLFGVVLLLGRVFAQREVTIQSIFGAVSAYIIIGLLFAAIYSAMYRFGNEKFFVNGETDNVKTFQYFSFTTLTTLGYGDYTAAGSGGQAVAVMEALLGQVFLATLVARLVAAFRGPRTPAAAGPTRPGRAARPGRAVGRPGRGPRPSFRRPRKPDGRAQPLPPGRVAQPALGGQPGQPGMRRGTTRSAVGRRARPAPGAQPRPGR